MIGEKIRELRERQGLTQAELAKKLGVTRSGVNAWEMGISMPSTQYTVALALFFEVSTDFLLDVESTASLPVDGMTDEDILLVRDIIRHLKKKGCYEKRS